MGRLAVIGGQSIGGYAGGLASVEDAGAEQGAVLDAGSHLVLHRHGLGSYTVAHRLDHAANLRALQSAGADRALAICSVGSLHAELAIGSFVAPDDFIALQLSVTATNGPEGHAVRGIDATWRARVIEAWQSKAEVPLRDGGVYWHSNGPRFETPAEVKLIATHADVVGMTMGAECVVAAELGLPYAAICVVDNLANGIGDASLSQELVEQGVEANREALGAALNAVLPSLCEEP